MPFVIVVYATVEIWYLIHGHPVDDVVRTRNRAPWNTAKCEPSFADRLAAARREILFPGLLDVTGQATGCLEIDLDLLELLLLLSALSHDQGRALLVPPARPVLAKLEQSGLPRVGGRRFTVPLHFFHPQ